ncbi:MAG: SPFH domain-containing protein [Candidatus Moranbacteria bacterium]|nr:SPFH domain-containing protein [Candidatus Moranbacteria bacterium]
MDKIEKMGTYVHGALFSIVIAMIGFIVIKLTMGWLYHPVVGTLLGLVGFAASLIYFFWMGLRKIPVGWSAIQLFLEERTFVIYGEGWNWYWPEPIGNMELVDTREQSLDIPLTEVLTEDNVPVTINLSLQYKICNIHRSLNISNIIKALSEAVESITRIVVQDIDSNDIAQEKKNIPHNVLNLSIEGFEEKTLNAYTRDQWGTEIIKIRVTHIRLPEKLEAARTNVQVMKAEQAKEEEQAKAERIEAENVAGLIEVFKGTGLSPEMAASIVQSERGKATRIIIDGSAKPIERAAGIIAAKDTVAEKISTKQPAQNIRRRKE